MYQVMVIVKGALSKQYFPISRQDKKTDADKDVAMLKELNPNYKFVVMDAEED